jgi:hypothetical protein
MVLAISFSACYERVTTQLGIPALHRGCNQTLDTMTYQASFPGCSQNEEPA